MRNTLKMNKEKGIHGDYRRANPVDDSYRATDGVELRTDNIEPS